MRKQKFTVLLFQDQEGVFLALCPAFPHFMTQGDTVEEALAAAKEALELNIESDVWDGEEILEDTCFKTVVISEVEANIPNKEEVPPPFTKAESDGALDQLLKEEVKSARHQA
jgi:predicted RNase H-like HicB family nuclease